MATVDYGVANQHVDKMTPLVADPSTIFSALKPDHQWFSVIDMTQGFLSVPLAEEVQPWFAFTIDAQQYQFTRTPMGLHNSPSVYHQALRRHLQEMPSVTSTLIQYVDDVLLATCNEEQHEKDLKILLDHLHKSGHKASFSKAQVMQEQVIYLGQKISQGK